MNITSQNKFTRNPIKVLWTSIGLIGSIGLLLTFLISCDRHGNHILNKPASSGGTSSATSGGTSSATSGGTSSATSGDGTSYIVGPNK